MKNSSRNRNKDILEIAHSQLPQAKVLACIFKTITDAQGRSEPYMGTYIFHRFGKRVTAPFFPQTILPLRQMYLI